MKITKEEFDNIFADIATDEMQEFFEKMKNPAGAAIIGLISASINNKLTARLFENSDELEIVKE